jgi:phospholipase/carboxylesterase
MQEHIELGFIHRFEPATQSGAPAMLLLHGSGGDENSLIAFGRAIAPGAALLSPRGNAVDHGSRRFFARPGNPSFSDPEMKERTSELARFARDASTHYEIKEPLVLAGFSNGANMAVHLLLHGHGKWSGAILMRGMAADDHSPDNNLHSLPVLLLSGIADPIVQTDQAEDLALQLRSAGAEVTLHWEETGHNLCQGDVLMAFDWSRRFYRLARPSSSWDAHHSKLKY